MLTVEEDLDAHALRRQGWTISAIARHLGRDRKTIRAYLNGERAPRQRRQAPDAFVPFLDYCRQRLADDPHLWASTLFDELVQLGCRGAYSTFTGALCRYQVRPHCEPCHASKGRDRAVIEHPPGEEIQFDWIELPEPPTGWGVDGHAHLLVGALAHSGRWRAVLAESEDFPHLIQALDQVLRRLGGTVRRWRFDRMATVCYPSSGQVTSAFAGVAKFYGVQVAICPPRRGNRKGVVEKANHTAAQRWWRTVPDGISVEQAQTGVDKLAVRMDERRRSVDGVKVTVAELASAEPLLSPPTLPFPAELEAERTVSPQALVSFEGNFYSVPPGMPGMRVTVRHRLGENYLHIVTAGRAVVARHELAPPGAGRRVRDSGHVIALERAVLAQVSDRAPVQDQGSPPALTRRAGRGRAAARPSGRRRLGRAGRDQPRHLCRRGRPHPHPRRRPASEHVTSPHERSAPLFAAAGTPVLPEAERRVRGPAPGAGPGPGREPVDDGRAGEVAGDRGRSHRGQAPRRAGAVRLPARALDLVRLRLLRPARRRREADPGPGHPPLPRRRVQRVVRRPARGRQDDAVRRARPGSRRRRPPGLLHHRGRARGQVPQGRTRRPVEGLHALLRRSQAFDHR
ncbi:hypothetical protein SCOCK_450039 [Actinacidiphila cocklensis]|uniref:Transposase n=1 Tax=Actinacidiphila cocklensis TaxID=887465 RepID=A0A9W4DZI8_9ACTN|nr:hypothetical protein SCOCK_450039 [Actinacidiphila cocklensis]